MIKLENFEVMGWEHVIRGMRNPMNSWEKSDSHSCKLSQCPECEYFNADAFVNEDFKHMCARPNKDPHYVVGPNDHELMMKLRKAGTDHRKFMRMITVYVDITAPMYWWSEFDTYKIGTVANSCSKMHKMLARPFEMTDFSFDKLPGYKYEPKQFRPRLDVDTEQWVEIEEYPGYFVSDQGRIKHLGSIRFASEHQDGYIFYTFKGKQVPVHRLVANAFIPKSPGKNIVNHKDGNKMNNFASNLEWVTQSENVQHSVDNHFQPIGLSTYTGKFTDEQRQQIKDEWNSGAVKSRRELAKKYGVSHTCINDILNDRYKYVRRENIYENVARPLVDTLNELRDSWIRCTDETLKKQIWYSILQLLPASYNQKRTVMLNYEVLANIYKSRKAHKLDEWREFCKWIEELPYSEIIVGEAE